MFKGTKHGNNVVRKAGAVIVRPIERGTDVLLLFRGKEQDWSFPKGHIETNETAEKAMLREVKEETGLDVKTIKELPELTYKTSAGESVELRMFLVLSKQGTAQPEKTTDRLEWIPLEKVASVLTHDNLKDYFRTAAPFCVS